MKARLLLAESAAVHPDGTVSILRSSISNLAGPAAPYSFRGCMVVRIHAEIGDEGDHSFDFCCRNEDGKTIGDTLKGSFAVEGAPQGVQNLVLMINLGFPKAGRYVFVLRIDNSIADEWPLSVRKSEKPQPEQQKPK